MSMSRYNELVDNDTFFSEDICLSVRTLLIMLYQAVSHYLRRKLIEVLTEPNSINRIHSSTLRVPLDPQQRPGDTYCLNSWDTQRGEASLAMSITAPEHKVNSFVYLVH